MHPLIKTLENTFSITKSSFTGIIIIPIETHGRPKNLTKGIKTQNNPPKIRIPEGSQKKIQVEPTTRDSSCIYYYNNQSSKPTKWSSINACTAKTYKQNNNSSQ